MMKRHLLNKLSVYLSVILTYAYCIKSAQTSNVWHCMIQTPNIVHSLTKGL